MKTINKCLVSVLSVLLLLTGIVTTGGTASALVPDYNVQSGDIYYFSDSSPILTEDTLYTYFGQNHYIFYDTQYYIEQQDFADLVEDGYFDGFESGCYVILEIKYLYPDPTVLKNLFENLKEQGCTVIFVCYFALSDFSDTEFMDYVDVYFHCKVDRFCRYVTHAVTHMFSNNFGVFSTILIDHRFFDIDCETADFQACYDASFFLRLLLKQLCYLWADADIATFADAITRGEIHLVINLESGDCIDLYTRDKRSVSDFDSLNELAMTIQPYAFGIWELESGFYDCLYQIQKVEEYFLPVYIWEDAPITYDPNGLEILSDSDLIDMYEEEPDNDAELLLQVLLQVISD